MTNGEEIPLSELQDFILSSEADLTQLKTAAVAKAKAKPTDVDFF